MTRPTCGIEARRAWGGLSALGVGYCHVPGPLAQAGMERAFGAWGLISIAGQPLFHELTHALKFGCVF